MGGMFPLEPRPEDMRAMGEAVLERLIAFYQGLDDAPAANTERALEVAAELRAAPPERGGEFEPLLEDVLRAAAHTFEFAGPGYLAYIPGGGLFTSALAEFLSRGLNRFGGLWAPSPAIVQIEEIVIRWMNGLFAYPAEGRGTLATAGPLG